MLAIDQDLLERQDRSAAAASDFLLVNLFQAPLGGPVRPDGINELFEALCVRAELSRPVTPHRCRHAFGSNLADAGALLDWIQRLRGHTPSDVTARLPAITPS